MAGAAWCHCRGGTLSRRHLVILAYLLDCLIGDPASLPHPVRLFGCCIHFTDHHLRRKNASPAEEFLLGTMLATALPAVTAWLTHRLPPSLQENPGAPHLASEMWEPQTLTRPLRTAATIFLAASCLATHGLLREALTVIRSLEQNDLPAARIQVARIVGRDTASLDEQGISRAVIEALAESLCDGIIAPLFYLALGGVPLALAFKAVSTMDSMIGHTTERYWYFGKCAARFDDAANFIPARISALLLCAASVLVRTHGGPQYAWRTWLDDGKKHASPNAGQVESAMAGALGIRVGGPNTYDGQLVEAPVLGSQYRAPRTRDARRALALTAIASALGFAVAVACVSGKRDSKTAA